MGETREKLVKNLARFAPDDRMTGRHEEWAEVILNAILLQLREPDDDMRKAGALVISEGGSPPEDMAAQVLLAMIEALGEETEHTPEGTEHTPEG